MRGLTDAEYARLVDAGEETRTAMFHGWTGYTTTEGAAMGERGLVRLVPHERGCLCGGRLHDAEYTAIGRIALSLWPAIRVGR